MSAQLSPAPDLRAAMTVCVDEISPEASDGRFEGRVQPICDHDRGIPQTEQPWWAFAVKCLALRMTQEEAAKFCDITTAQLGRAYRSPLFQVRLREALKDTTTPLTALFADAGIRAFQIIVDVMEGEKTPAAVKLASAKEVIDRCLGKAPLTIKHEDKEATSDPVALVEHLKTQNAELRKQLPN